MAFQIIDYTKTPFLPSPGQNLFENVLKGYQIAKEPAKMAEEQKQRELANQLKSLEVEHKPTEYALSDKEKTLANAIREQALKHPMMKGAFGNAMQIRENLDPNDPNYERDLKAINNYMDRLAGGASQVSLGQAGQGIKIDLPQGKSGFVPGLGKLKSGWVPVQDDQGNVIGVNVPMTDKQIDQWKAKEKFDVIFPFMNQSLSTYSGRNSWENYIKDARNYNSDPSAKERIDNYLAARSLMSIGSTTENARIGGHATNAQLKALKDTLDSSEIHKRLEQGAGFVLPSKYAQASGDIFKAYLDKVEETAKTNVPAYEFRSLNPGINTPAMSNPLVQNAAVSNAPPEVLSVNNGIAQVRHQGKLLNIPERLLDRFMMEHSPQGAGG